MARILELIVRDSSTMERIFQATYERSSGDSETVVSSDAREKVRLHFLRARVATLRRRSSCCHPRSSRRHLSPSVPF